MCCPRPKVLPHGPDVRTVERSAWRRSHRARPHDGAPMSTFAQLESGTNFRTLEDGALCPRSGWQLRIAFGGRNRKDRPFNTKEIGVSLEAHVDQFAVHLISNSAAKCECDRPPYSSGKYPPRSNWLDGRLELGAPLLSHSRRATEKSQFDERAGADSIFGKCRFGEKSSDVTPGRSHAEGARFWFMCVCSNHGDAVIPLQDLTIRTCLLHLSHSNNVDIVGA